MRFELTKGYKVSSCKLPMSAYLILGPSNSEITPGFCFKLLTYAIRVTKTSKCSAHKLIHILSCHSRRYPEDTNKEITSFLFRVEPGCCAVNKLEVSLSEGEKKKSKPGVVHSESLKCPTLRQKSCVKGGGWTGWDTQPPNPKTIIQVPDCIVLYMQMGTDYSTMGHSNWSLVIRAQIFWFVCFVIWGGGWQCWRTFLFKCLNTYVSTWSPWFKVMQPINVVRRVKCHLSYIAPTLLECRTTATPHGPLQKSNQLITTFRHLKFLTLPTACQIGALPIRQSIAPCSNFLYVTKISIFHWEHLPVLTSAACRWERKIITFKNWKTIYPQYGVKHLKPFPKDLDLFA